MTASAVQKGKRLISVVMGAASEEARARASQSLLQYGSRFFETHKLYAAGQNLAELLACHWGSDRDLGQVLAAVIDGLGHGPKARLAARAAQAGPSGT